MPITIQCPECLTIHTASDLVLGRRVRCPACGCFADVADPEGPPAGSQQPQVSDSDEVQASPQPPLTEASETGSGLRDVNQAAEAADNSPESGVPGAAQAASLPAAPARGPAAAWDAEGQEPERAFSPKPHLEDTELDMTPMVDVVFQLLIFFMLTAAFALQKSLTLPKVSDDQPSENVVAKSIESSPEYVIVQVDEFGTFHVFTVDWDEEAPSDQDLHIKLRRAREGSVNGVIPSKLMVEAHGDALHGRVVAALDAGTATGFEEVQLTTVEEN